VRGKTTAKLFFGRFEAPSRGDRGASGSRHDRIVSRPRLHRRPSASATLLGLATAAFGRLTAIGAALGLFIRLGPRAQELQHAQ